MLAGLRPAGGGLGDGRCRSWPRDARSTSQPFRRALPPYPEADWAAADANLPAMVDGVHAGPPQALGAAGAASDPATGGWQPGEPALAAGPHRAGRASRVRGAPGGCSDTVVRSRGGFHDASRELFPHLDTVIAYRLLFGIYSGIVPDGIDGPGHRRHRLGR